jgi:hypothetical protein
MAAIDDSSVVVKKINLSAHLFVCLLQMEKPVLAAVHYYLPSQSSSDGQITNRYSENEGGTKSEDYGRARKETSLRVRMMQPHSIN